MGRILVKGIAEEDVSVMGSDAPVFTIEAETVVDIEMMEADWEERFRDPTHWGHPPDDEDYDAMLGVFQYQLWAYDPDFELRFGFP